MNEEIMVSVSCLVYNHAKYLRKCLDGFVNQKTNFKFEVLVHDDASTDGSQDIIREYEEKYPDIIKPIYQKENQHSKGVANTFTYQFPRAKGKYLAYCEGDDYWCDEYKLQKQVDALENNPECVISTCRVRFMNEAGEPLDEYRPALNHPIKDGIQDSNWLISLTPEYTFQTASFLLNKQLYFDFRESHKDLVSITGVSRVELLSMFSLGKCYFFEEPMAMYRVSSVGSWTQRQHNIENKINHLKRGSDFYKAYEKYLIEEYADYDKLDLTGMHNTIDYNDVFVATFSHQYKLLFTKEYRRKLREQFTLKNRVLYVFIAMFPKLSKGYVKKYV